MKRLREIESASPLVRRAQAMIDATPPLPESRERMLRIRRELERPRGPLVFARRLPALVLAGAVVLFGASAFAAVRIFVALQPEAEPKVLQRPSAHPAVRRAQRAAPEPVQVAAAAAVGNQAVVAAAEAEATAEPVARTQAPRRAVRSTAGRRARRAEARAAARLHSGSHQAAEAASSVAPGDVAARTSETAAKPAPEPQAVAAMQAAEPRQEKASLSDAALVHRAVRALRRERDPALAVRLLEQKAARDPSGPLAEEALSLRIEAALALDDPRATGLAREYLARYPRGRYLAVARRALREAER